jgi:hypothetical protein
MINISAISTALCSVASISMAAEIPAAFRGKWCVAGKASDPSARVYDITANEIYNYEYPFDGFGHQGDGYPCKSAPAVATEAELDGEPKQYASKTIYHAEYLLCAIGNAEVGKSVPYTNSQVSLKLSVSGVGLVGYYVDKNLNASPDKKLARCNFGQKPVD